MPSLEEVAGTQGTPLSADLGAGIAAISYDQELTFTLYVRMVLPLDGFVFWVKSTLLSPSAMANAMLLNSLQTNASPAVETPAREFKVKGSLHYASVTNQDEAESYVVNSMVFTTQKEVVDLNSVGRDTLYIAEHDGVKFTFSTRGSFYQQANVYHYRGQAVYADMATQVIDSLIGFDTRNVVVSNSLPVWLGFNGYEPIYPTFGNPVLPLYPSFALPENIVPPFASVHIDPAGTEALQGAPYLNSKTSHYQLTRDRVRITIWGLRNNLAQDFLECVYQFCQDNDLIGMMNVPIIRDEKRIQSELNTLAQKKTIEFEVSYYQTRIRDLTRQLIKEAFVEYYPTHNF